MNSYDLLTENWSTQSFKLFNMHFYANHYAIMLTSLLWVFHRNVLYNNNVQIITLAYLLM